MWSYHFVRRVVLVCCFLFVALVACAPEQEMDVSPSSLSATNTPAIPTVTAVDLEVTEQAGSTPQAAGVTPTAVPEVAVGDEVAGSTSQDEDTGTPGQPTAVPLPVREEMNFTLVAQLGGTVNAVALAGNIVYAGIGPRLVTIDIGNPAAPRLLGQSEVLPDVVQAVAVGDEVGAGVVYVGAGRDLFLYDVSDPAAPVKISALGDFGDPPENFIRDIIVAGNTVYTLGQELIAVDVSDLTHPVVAERFFVPDGAGIMVSGNVVYVAHEGRVQLVDAITLDKVLGEIEIELVNEHGGSYLVTVAGNWVYAGFSNPFGDQPLVVVDVSNPGQPEKVATSQFNLPALTTRVAASDETLFLVDQRNMHGPCPTFLYAIDIADAASPRLAAEFDPQGCINDIAAAGDTLVAASGSKVQIFDASDLAHIRLAGELAHPSGLHDVQTLALNQDVAYIFSRVGEPAHLRVLDMTRPGAPGVIGDAVNLTLNDDPRGAGGLYAGGNKLVLQWFAGLIPIDISQPTNPRQIMSKDGNVGFWSWPAAPASAGNVIYLPVEGGLGILDMSDPANPVLANTIAAGSISFEDRMLATERYLIVAGGMRLRFFDVSDPYNPVEAGQFRLTNSVQAMTAAGDTVYAADGGSIYILDLSDPARPAEVGRFALPFGVTKMVAAGDTVYLSTASEIWAMNVGDRSRPYLAGHFPFAGEDWGVAGDWLYVAGGDAGLYIVSASTSGACVNDSVFVRDVNVPDGTHFAPGAVFTKTWRLRNSGSCTWDDSYRLNFVSGERMDGPESIEIGETVPPGGEVDVSIGLIAPQADGIYQGQWQLVAPDGTPFGAKPYVEIAVP